MNIEHTVAKQRDIAWRRSGRCESETCVEVAHVDATYLIRDSEAPDGPRLMFNTDEWRAFTAGVLAGDFDFDVEVS